MNIETKTEIVEQAFKASPPVAVGALTVAGVSLSDMVLLATLVYTVSQIIFLFRDKVWLDYKRRRDERKSGTDETTSPEASKQDGEDA